MPRLIKLTRLLGVLRRKRKRPNTLLGVFLRSVERMLCVMAVLYGCLHLYPQVLFAHSFSQEGITVYASAPLPLEAEQRIDEIAELVGQSELAVLNRRQRIFICNDPWLYRLFAPLHGDSFAASVLVTDNVFVAEADLAHNAARRGGGTFNVRSFSGVTAHEITHGLIRLRVGRLRSVMVNDWVTKGYADYVAGESSYPEEQGLEFLATGKRDPSPSFQYFLWRKMVQHVLEEQELSFDELVSLSGDAERVERETVLALQNEEYSG